MSYIAKNMALRDACEVQAGYTARTRLEDRGEKTAPAIQLRDLHGRAAVSISEAGRFTLDGDLDRYRVSAGDVLFRSRGDSNTAAVVKGEAGESAVAVMPLIILRAEPGVILPEYLTWYINQSPAQRHFDQCARGTGMRMIPRACLDTLPLVIPDIQTQKAVVAAAALADREAELLTALAAQKQRLTSFVLLEQVRKAQLHGHGAGQSATRQDADPDGQVETDNS